jgi:hypothetical protein
MVLHPLAVIDHALAIIGLGLLSGTGCRTGFGYLMLALAAGFATGYLYLIYGTALSYAWLAPLMFAALAGGLTALAVSLPFWVLAGFTALVGAAIGSETFPETWERREFILSGAGALIGVALLFILSAAIGRAAQRDWQRIGIRIPGSWITASAMLVLTLVAASFSK